MRFARFASVPSRFFTRHSSPAQTSLAKFLAPARYIAVALFVVAVATPGFSQSDRGAIAGTVLDSSGAAVANATVTATGAQTGILYKTTSTATGTYRISDMQVGAYDIVV